MGFFPALAKKFGSQRKMNHRVISQTSHLLKSKHRQSSCRVRCLDRARQTWGLFWRGPKLCFLTEPPNSQLSQFRLTWTHIHLQKILLSRKSCSEFGDCWHFWSSVLTHQEFRGSFRGISYISFWDVGKPEILKFYVNLTGAYGPGIKIEVLF